MNEQKKTSKHSVIALRDLRYMLEARSQNDVVFKFLIDRLYIFDENDSIIMIHADFTQFNDNKNNFFELCVSDYTDHEDYSFQQQSRTQQTKEFLSRLRMTLFDECSLIASMLIMRLHSTLVTSLITTFVFILAVSITIRGTLQNGIF
jgi:hypothetical protein